MPTGVRRSQQLLALVAWLVAGFIIFKQVRGLVELSGAWSVFDLENYFLLNALDVREGGSPYDTPGYPYTPVLAWVLAIVYDVPHVAGWWKAASIAAGLLAAGALAFKVGRSGWSWTTPVILAVAAVSLESWWVLHREVASGQVQQFTLLALVGAWASWRRPALSGSLMAAAILIKVWLAAVAATWLVSKMWPAHPGRTRSLSRYLRHWWLRRRAFVVACCLPLVALAALTFHWYGFRSIGLLREALDYAAAQQLAAYSAPGLLRPYLGPGHTIVTPLTTPWLAWLVIALLVILLLVAIRTTSSVTLLNQVAIILLLLPVAHLQYLVLILPVAWWWVGVLTVGLAQRRLDYSALLGALASVAWWWGVQNYRPSLKTSGLPPQQVATITALTIGFVCVSVVLAALRDAASQRRTTDRSRVAVGGITAG